MLSVKFHHRILFFITFSFGLVLLGTLLNNKISYGQITGWSIPFRISSKGQTSWFPDVAVDRAGTVHIVWASGVVGYDLVYYSAFFNDGTQLDPIEIRALEANAGSEATRPTLFVDQNDILHLTFRDTRVYYSQVNVLQAHSARYWSPDQLMGEGYFSRVARDSKGRLHYIFTQNVVTSACPICYHVFYRYSNDGGTTWSKEVDISKGPLGSAKPQLLIDANDNLHVVYEAGIGGSYGQLSDVEATTVMYIGSYDNGLTWERPTQLNPFEMIAKNITIGLYGKDKLMTVWWNVNDDSIYYQISDDLGKNWSLPIKLPGVMGIWQEHQARLDDYSIATDANGNLHLVFVGLLDNRVDLSSLPTLDPTLPTPTSTLTPTPQPTPTGIIPTEDLRRRMNLLYMNWTDGKWSKPEILSSYVGDVPEWPRIAVGLGNQLHVVWFVRADKDVWNGGGDYTIYYASKKVSAPLFTPAKLPTIVPIEPTKEATEVVETLTPTPVMDLPLVEQKPTWSLVYKEMDYLSVAVITALPVVFFIGIFALILRKLRR